MNPQAIVKPLRRIPPGHTDRRFSFYCKGKRLSSTSYGFTAFLFEVFPHDTDSHAARLFRGRKHRFRTSEPSEIPITKQGGAACLRVKNRYGLLDGHFLLFTHSGFLTFCAASCASFWVSGAVVWPSAAPARSLRKELRFPPRPLAENIVSRRGRRSPRPNPP